jgi:hypothetical protein
MGLSGRLLTGFVGFVLGAVAGIVGTAWWMEQGIRHANQIILMQTVAAEGEEAFKQYRSAKHDVALYALERYAAVLESYQGQNLQQFDHSSSRLILHSHIQG